MARPAVFLDRDGVLNVSMRGDWVRSPEGFRWIPGSIEAVRAFNDAGVPVVVVTNQSGIGRGVVTSEAVQSVNDRMMRELADAGARLDGIYICPHAPGGDCLCRKPMPGLLTQACEELDLDASRSVMVGDSERDLAAGYAAGCAAGVAVLSGLNTEDDVAGWETRPGNTFSTLYDAYRWIIDRMPGS